MNIAVCHSQVPFVRGGAEVLVDGLIHALKQAGHHVTLVAVPFKWYPRAQLSLQALLWRTLDLDQLAGRPIDLVICTKYPTWAVKHPRKVIWLVHQHRQVYDWYGTPLSDFGLSADDQQARQVVLQTDFLGLSEATRIFTISKNVATRLERYTGLKGEPLYPPTQFDDYYHADYGDYIFTISRLDSAKRLNLLLEALSYTKSGVRAIIAGSGPDKERLQARAKKLGLSKRVEFVGRVSDEEAVRLYAHALAVFYAPIDEDYGLVTIEAMRSAKAVLTAPDSGGVLEFVKDAYNGYICENPSAFATAMDQLYLDKKRELAASLGQAALQTFQIIPSWSQIAQTLTSF